MEPNQPNRQMDSVWAVEGGVQVGFERLQNRRVRITIWENFAAVNERVVSQVTLENWRWDRIVEAMKLKESAQAAKDTGAPESTG